MNVKLLFRLLRLAAATLILLILVACNSQSPNTVAPQAPALNTPASQPAVANPTNTPGEETQAAVPTVLVTATRPEPTQPAEVQPTDTPATSQPTCKSPAALTPALTEGPYFKTGSPERTSLIDSDTQGTILTLSGYVLTTDCQPVAHALLDFWQADAQGQYDNTGYTLRGHQFTDEAGRFQLVTVVPGLYPGRTEHIHFKVQAPNGPILTSQLFFPGVGSNQSDRIYDPALLINVLAAGAGRMEASFEFIL